MKDIFQKKENNQKQDLINILIITKKEKFLIIQANFGSEFSSKKHFSIPNK